MKAIVEADRAEQGETTVFVADPPACLRTPLADRFWEPAPTGEEGIVVTPLPNRPLTSPSKDPLGQPLSAREKQILRLIALGESYAAIAFELGMTAKVVDKHAERIHRKLGAHCIAHLVHYALANGEVNLLFKPGETALGVTSAFAAVAPSSTNESFTLPVIDLCSCFTTS